MDVLIIFSNIYLDKNQNWTFISDLDAFVVTWINIHTFWHWEQFSTSHIQTKEYRENIPGYSRMQFSMQPNICPGTSNFYH